MFSKLIVALLLAVSAMSCADMALSDPAATNSSRESNASLENENAAYLVFNYRIHNREAYNTYLTQVPQTLEAYGAEVIVADFDSNVVEGAAGSVTVVLKFASKTAATTWYHSPEYQKIIRLRTDNSAGLATLAVDR